MRIAIISDTHDVLRPEVLEQVRASDAVIHAGDVCRPDIVDKIRDEMKNSGLFYLVRGNNDREWAENIPMLLEFELEGIRFLAVHDKADIPEKISGKDIVIYGHSHRYEAKEHEGVLWLNPGACGRKRFFQELTMAVLRVERGCWELERLVIVPGEEPRIFAYSHPASPGRVLQTGELFGLITEILARMDRRQTTDKIAAEMGLEKKFVEEICRIRVTHPGVTESGILDKLEANRKGRAEYRL